MIQNKLSRRRNYSSGYYTSSIDNEGVRFNDDNDIEDDEKVNKKDDLNENNQTENEIKSKENKSSQSLSANLDCSKEKVKDIEEIAEDLVRPNLLRDKIMQLPISNFYKKYLLYNRDF